MHKTWLRSLQGLALVSSIAFLTGAKGQGCGSGGGGETGEGGSNTVCPDGQLLQSVCDGHGSCDPSGCHDVCAPLCPPGSEPQQVCTDDPPPPDCPPDAPCAEPNIPADCGYVCAPIAVCPAGYHQESVCGGGEPGNPGPSDPGQPIPVDDGSGGGVSSPGNPGDPGCPVQCVPDACPPGSIQQTVCSDPGSGAGGGSGTGGGVVYPVSDDATCWNECVPAAPCPPGQHQVEGCAVDDNGNETCDQWCEDDNGGGGTGGWIGL